MPDKYNVPDDLPEEARITTRFDRDLQIRIWEHLDRLARRNRGVSVSTADSIRNLIETGSRTWRATDKSGFLSPAALLAVLTDEAPDE
jgi:macrodomain Ter protein organizer (MatP/YcbG family)